MLARFGLLVAGLLGAATQGAPLPRIKVSVAGLRLAAAAPEPGVAACLHAPIVVP